MQETFKQVQDSFMDLGIFLSDLDLERDLYDKEKLNEIYLALRDTYTLFQHGLCETAYMCDKCETKEKEFGRLVEMMEAAAHNGRVSKEGSVALIEFMYIIPDTLAEIKNFYLESLSS